MKYILYTVFMYLCLPAMTQQKKAVKVLLLGTFHFDNPGLDVAKFKDANILSPQRQQEVQEVTGLLKVFAPDKIFIEAIPAKQPQIDSSFVAYKAGKMELRATEVHQLAFRLAKELNLSTLYGVDYREAEFPFDSLMKSATEAKQTDITSFVEKTIGEVQQSFNEALQKSTIREMLLRENSEALMRLQHEFYFKLLPAGKPGNHIGSYLVSEWWRRNMVIYENILKQLNGNEEKIMVIFGSGHTAILNEIMKFNPTIELVPVADVLKTAK
jgi:Family of unknown function (DUF5694)